MTRVRALFVNGAISQNQYLFSFREVRVYWVDSRRPPLVNGILTRDRASINVGTIRGGSVAVLLDRAINALHGRDNIFNYPPIARVTFLIVIASLIIRSIDRFITSRSASDAVIRNVIDFQVRREEL